MKILISPAKSLGKINLQTSSISSEACFLDEAESLIKKLRKFSVKKIEKMMHVSSDIANLNYTRFQTWEKPICISESIAPALAQFSGEVYKGLDSVSLTKDQLEFVQNNLRILSGLYGILKPMDLMYPYRLEMGTNWQITPKIKGLYAFWGKKISNSLNAEMEQKDFVINLASIEYFKAIDKKVLKAKVITPHFKELKNGNYTTIAIFAKNARGKMTRYIIDNKINNVDDLKLFNWDGYLFQTSLSSETDWVFTR